MKQVPYCVIPHIWRHRTKFSRHGELAPEIWHPWHDWFFLSLTVLRSTLYIVTGT